MSNFPTVTSIITVPALTLSGQGFGSLLVGIVIDSSKVAWGTCEESAAEYAPASQPPAFELAPFAIDESMATLEEIVAPALIGKGLSSFRELATIIESLKQAVTVNIPNPKKEYQAVSRRSIITGFLSSSEVNTESDLQEQAVVERPLHPALRHGLSQALLSAVATVQGVTETEIIAREFELPHPSKAVPLQMRIRRGQSLQLHSQVSALAYTAGGSNLEDSLGPNAERIQRFVRKFRETLVNDQKDCRLTIHLDVQGGLGKLYDDDLGMILGALYGLEQAASPCPIRVENSIIMEEPDDQIEISGQLRDYVRMRQMSLNLVAAAGINSLDDVQAFARAGSAHMLRLVMSQMGSIQELILGVQACQEAGIGVLMEGIPNAVTSQVALAAQPDLLTYPADRPGDDSIAAFHNEMARTLSWLANKAK